MANSSKAIRNRIVFMMNIIFSIIYIIWRTFFTVPFGYGTISLVAGLSLLIIEIMGMLEAAVHYYNMHKVESHPVPEVPLSRFPDVDVFIATYNEPLELLYKTVNGCTYLDYPDKTKVHIYLCDDGRRPEIEKLAADFGVHYLKRADNKGAKAGNLNNALAHSDSPLIVTLDADMIPKHDFLLKTVPYFVDFDLQNEGREEKRKLGFVQTPQSFYNPDLFQFNLFSEGRIPNEQDYFYKDIQVTRNKTNSVIYGGSNTVLAREGIVEIGGFYTEAITEDYATGMLLQKNKYICYATNEVLASGLSPTDLKSLIQQRTRWARGVIATSRKMHILLTPKLKFGQKINYWASTWYWYAPVKRLIYFLSPLLYAVFGVMVLKCTLQQVLIFWLPMYVTSNLSLKLLSRNIRTVRWTSIYETVLFPFMIMPVIFETFGITLKKFKVTKKGEAENEKGKNTLYMLPFLILIVFSVIGILNCVTEMFNTNVFSSIVVVFWLVNNLFILVMALFFVQGRTLNRKSERVQASEACRITGQVVDFYCQTNDFSETGISVLTDRPYDIDENETIGIEIKTARYQVGLSGKVVHVSQFKKRWKYAIIITDMNGCYNDYLQILYDRVPTLPSNLSESHSSFEDLNLNVKKRAEKSFYENRKMARISVFQKLSSREHGDLFVENFNYKYIVLDTKKIFDQVTVLTPNGLPLECRFFRNIHGSLKLFEVMNYVTIRSNQESRALLDDWILELSHNWFDEESGEGGVVYEKTEMDYL